jgi:hypothetical protein
MYVRAEEGAVQQSLLWSQGLIVGLVGRGNSMEIAVRSEMLARNGRGTEKLKTESESRRKDGDFATAEEVVRDLNSVPEIEHGCLAVIAVRRCANPKNAAAIGYRSANHHQLFAKIS